MIRNLIIGLVVGGIFLALALWGVPLDELGTALLEMRVVYLVPLALTLALQYLSRAHRQQLLVQPLAPRTHFRTQLSILCIGFFCVNTFPARLGEAVRPYLLYERENVPLGAGLGATFTERLIDLIGLFVMLFGVILWVDVPDRSVELLGRQLSLVDLGRGAAVTLLLPVLMVLGGLALFGPRVLKALTAGVDWAARRFEAAWIERLGGLALRFLGSFVEGLRVLRDPVRLVAVLAHTVLIFATMGAGVLLCAWAFDMGAWVGIGESFGVLGILMLALALPAPPGFAGVYEAAVRGGLLLFGASGGDLDARALALALVLHWYNYLLLAAAAGYFLWADGIQFGKLLRFARGGSEASAQTS